MMKIDAPSTVIGHPPVRVIWRARLGYYFDITTPPKMPELRESC